MILPWREQWHNKFMKLCRILGSLFLAFTMGHPVRSFAALEAKSITNNFSSTSPTEKATFPGRVSRINSVAGLVRVRVEFKNAKFLNKADRIEFWSDTNPNNRCVAHLEARSTEYLLIRVPELDACVRKVQIAVGSYILFWSKDLENNLKTAQELVEILMKKRMALLAKKRRHERDLEGHIERIEAINKRYEILRRKLEAELHSELQDLEEDRANQFVAFKQAESRLNEIESKLESYRIHDENFTLDRWSLDPNLYIKK